jgi:hypothetical protein
MLKVIIAGVAIVASLTIATDQAEAFGGRGYARRHARHVHHVPAPVVVQRVYVAPVVGYYRAPIYYRPPVSVNVGVGRYNSYYGPGFYGPHHRGGGVSVGIGW